MSAKVAKIIERELGIDKSEVKLGTPLRSLVTDSLEMANLILEFEEAFSIEILDEQVHTLCTVQDVVNYIYRHN